MFASTFNDDADNAKTMVVVYDPCDDIYCSINLTPPFAKPLTTKLRYTLITNGKLKCTNLLVRSFYIQANPQRATSNFIGSSERWG